MRILYGIQGTGNGHISRARTFLPLLEKVAEVDVLVSGTSSEVKLGRQVNYQVHGLGYTFGKNGGIDYIDSLRKFKPLRLLRDIRTLPVHSYDLIISDFEPITSRAAMRTGRMCISLSHQAAFLSPKSPRPKPRNILGEYIFHRYAPGSNYIGFHYQRYDDTIFNPVISKQIRDMIHKNHPQGGHVTVYLPSYDDRMLTDLFMQIPRVEWQVFSKNAQRPYQTGNVKVRPVDHDAYVSSLAGCQWLVCGAGFEAPSEGLFLGKAMLAIPMVGQYEQQCNGEALRQLGVSVRRRLDKGSVGYLEDWLDKAVPVHIPYEDQSDSVVARILNLYEMGISGTRFAM